MPPVRYYEVMETRVVKVRGTDALEAAKVGSQALSGEITKGPGEGRKITDPPRVIGLETREIGAR